MTTLPSISQRPIITSSFPLISTDLIEPSREEVAEAMVSVDQLLSQGMTEIQRLQDTKAQLQHRLRTHGNPGATLDGIIFQAQRQQIAETNEVPWTSMPPQFVDDSAAVRNNTYTSPAEVFARQPPVPLLVTETHPNTLFRSTPNYAVSDVGILPIGNQYIPQPYPDAMSAPDGFVNVVSPLPVSSIELAPALQTTWTSREPTYVAPVGFASREALGALDVSYQAFISMDSAFWPFPSEL